jgi:hypothetical protein
VSPEEGNLFMYLIPIFYEPALEEERGDRVLIGGRSALDPTYFVPPQKELRSIISVRISAI